jgi:hypothetical protein
MKREIELGDGIRSPFPLSCREEERKGKPSLVNQLRRTVTALYLHFETGSDFSMLFLNVFYEPISSPKIVKKANLFSKNREKNVMFAIYREKSGCVLHESLGLILERGRAPLQESLPFPRPSLS